MTVSSQTSNETFYGNGVTTVWDLPFRFFDNADIDVYLVDPATQTTTPLALGTDYTLFGAGLPEQFGAAPGKITTTTPVPDRKQLYVERVMDTEQLTDIVNQGRFFPEVHEDVFDRLTMLIQQANAWIGRALVQPIGKAYYDAKNRLIKNLADGGDDQDAVNIRTMRSYVDSMIAGVVGGFGYFLQAGVGAVLRTFQSKMRDTVSVMDFGAIGGSIAAYHPLSERFGTLAAAQAVYPFVTSLTQSIDWAAIQAALNTGKLVYAPSGKYVITDKLLVPAGGGLVGDGAGRWVIGYTNIFFGDSGTNLIFYGTGAKTTTLPHVSAASKCGGTINNPSAAVAHYAAANCSATQYKLIEFSNSNAVGATPATLRPFSVAIEVAQGGNVRLENFRAVPWFNGQSGYQDPSSNQIGDNWDVCLYLRNTSDVQLKNVQGVGYWRTASLLKACIARSWDVPENNENDAFENCKFQGHTGVSVRGYDMHRVVAKTSTTISIDWYAQHTFQGPSRLQTGNGQFAYSSVSYDSINSRLDFDVTGTDTTPVVIGTWLTEYGTTFGTSGTQFLDCQIADIMLAQRVVSTNTMLATPFATMGKALELAGEPSRAIQFTNCTMAGRDDIMVYQTRSRDAQFIGTYMEAQGAFAVPNGGTLVLPAGGRWIALQGGAPLADIGGAENLRCVGTLQQTIDKRPFGGTAIWPRFIGAGDTGLFRPITFHDDQYHIPSQVDGNLVLRGWADVGMTCGVDGTFPLTRAGGTDITLRGRSGNMDITGVTRVRVGRTASDGTGKVIDWTLSEGGITPATDGDKDLGSSVARFDEGFINRLRISTATIISGNGSPEGGITASVGSLYFRLNGGANSTLYVKETGAGNTGWVAK